MPKDSVRRVQFSTTAAKQYFDLLNSQPRLESKVDALIDSILQNPESGIGKPDLGLLPNSKSS
jgi:Txe/YoeB family toxin of Txe-Axe toxin-antitoxin module